MQETTPSNRRRFLKQAATAGAGLAAGCALPGRKTAEGPTILAPSDRPTGLNLLVISIDTLRWDHVGYNKQLVGWIKEKRQKIRTPNIDRLAGRATICDRHYIGSFPTVPQRTDCFTGNVNFPRYDWKTLGDEETILTEVLREAGYYTCLTLDTTNMIGTNFPRGFHEFYRTLNPPPGGPKPDDIPMPGPRENYRQGGGQRRSQLAGQWHFKEESDWWVAQTMAKGAEWLAENGKRDKWFLWLDTFEIHEVWAPPQEYIDLYDSNFDSGIDYDFPNYGYTDIYSDAELHHLWARYAGEVTLTDHWIGRVLDQLDEQGLWDRTMVVLQSDHGMYIGEHDRTGKHTVKGDDPWPLYEEVAHVPHLVHLPFRGARSRTKALTQHADLMATALEAVGVTAPETHGRSYLPAILGERKTHWDKIISSWHSPQTKKKMTTGRLSVTQGSWAYVARELDLPAELYNLDKDPRQQRNVLEKYPEVGQSLQQEVVNYMRAQGAADAYVEQFA
jgi:arylsulfatase A-like enzyme